MYYRQTVKVGDWDLVKGLNWSPLWSDEEEEDGETVQCEKISHSQRRPVLEGPFYVSCVAHVAEIYNTIQPVAKIWNRLVVFF